MDRKSIVAFVAIYALVAGVGFVASDRNEESATQPAMESEGTEPEIGKANSLNTAILAAPSASSTASRAISPSGSRVC